MTYAPSTYLNAMLSDSIATILMAEDDDSRRREIDRAAYELIRWLDWHRATEMRNRGLGKQRRFHDPFPPNRQEFRQTLKDSFQNYTNGSSVYQEADWDFYVTCLRSVVADYLEIKEEEL